MPRPRPAASAGDAPPLAAPHPAAPHGGALHPAAAHGGAAHPAAARRAAALGLAAALALLAGLWASGALDAIGHWAIEQQRALQALMGERVRALRAGESPLALLGLIGLCAAYGFVHAVGPGHGKVLVTGAALGTAASRRRMAAIALAGSLLQAVFAIVLVYGGFALFGLTARGAVGLETAFEPLGHLAVALIGAWLISRGLWTAGGGTPHPAHGEACGCGHAHGPDPAAVARASGLRESAALALAMAARPCAGALVVLVLAWTMGLALQGAAAVIAMGLGTASFTVAVAVLAVSGRDAALFSAGPALAARRLMPALQIGAGAVILGVSGALLCATLAT